MTKAQLKAILVDMEAKGIPDSAIFAVKVLEGGIMALNPNSYAIVGEDSDITLDASDHWAGVASEASAVYLKQA